MKKIILFFALILGATNGFSQYTVTNFISGLPYPICFEIAPDGRYFVTLKGGDGSGAAANAKVRVYSSTGTLLSTFWDFTDSTEVYFERGVLGITLDPDFTNNHYVYVFYNHDSPAMIRVVRFTEVANVGTNPTVIFEYNDPFTAGNHTGGNIHFRPSEPDKLYISLGDRATSSNAQLLTNPCGKFLRINSDGTIPTDNPYYDDGNPSTGNDDRIWTHGHRNPFDFTFSTINDSLYSTENGLNTWDEVNMVTRGLNYGWSTCEGFYQTGSTSVDCPNASFQDPMDDWGAPLPAVTGIIIYDHTLMPEFQGHMLVVDFDYGDIADFTMGGTALNQVTNRTTVPVTLGTLDALTEIVQGPEGCIYVIHGGYSTNGAIRKICPTGMGVNENEKLVSFEIAPNPANEMITIQYLEIQKGSTMIISDISGREVYSQSVNSDKVQLSASAFAAGTYFVTTYSENGQVTRKLIIE